MEKFFKIKESNEIYKEYFEWWNNLEIEKNAWGKFKKLTGIEADNIAFSENLIFIPTNNDIIKFGKFLNKTDLGNGLRQVNQKSPLQKSWANFLFANNIKILHKPNISFDFPYIFGPLKTRLFHYENELYCSVQIDNVEDIKTPEGYEEIKGSDFYKIIEKIEESNNGNDKN